MFIAGCNRQSEELKTKKLAKDRTYDVDLAGLKEGAVEEFDFRIGKEFFEKMENDTILGSDVDVHLDVEKRHGSYSLKFDTEGTLEVPCDRCLEAVTIPADAEYDLVVKYGEEFDDSTDNVLVLPYSQTSLDVAPIIYDTLMLTIPLRCVHEEGECNPEMTGILSEHNGRGDAEVENEVEGEEGE